MVNSHAWEYTEVGMLNEIECCRNCSSRLDKTLLRFLKDENIPDNLN